MKYQLRVTRKEFSEMTRARLEAYKFRSVLELNEDEAVDAMLSVLDGKVKWPGHDGPDRITDLNIVVVQPDFILDEIPRLKRID